MAPPIHMYATEGEGVSVKKIRKQVQRLPTHNGTFPTAPGKMQMLQRINNPNQCLPLLQPPTQ